MGVSDVGLWVGLAEGVPCGGTEPDSAALAALVEEANRLLLRLAMVDDAAGLMVSGPAQRVQPRSAAALQVLFAKVNALQQCLLDAQGSDAHSVSA
ncbi:MAG: hypothetical protein HQL87_10830 [Magnetococcales bacterium]|nr:hypothetical protein [Magnetococcales bacterium]